MHVTGKDEVEGFEDFLDARVGEEERGMSDENLGFLGGEFREAVFYGVEAFFQDVEVFVASIGVFAVVNRG